MRYALLLHSAAPAEGQVDEAAMAKMRQAMQAYGQALEEAGVLVRGDMLGDEGVATTVRVRDGEVQVQDGPFAETKESLGGMIVIDVPGIDQAMDWAKRHPAATYGAIELRPVAISLVDGQWA